MRPALIILLISLVLFTSGCIRETGELGVRFQDIEPSEEANVSEEPENITEEANVTKVAGLPLKPEEPEEEAPENVTVNVTEAPEELCLNVTCEDSITTCPDGEVMTCENTCVNETGNCTSCIPDCSEHQLPEPEECILECGTCQILDEEECECIIKLYCDGNDICEPGNKEWPDGADCLKFGSCDDKDNCTQDVFDPNQQACVHENVCCDDGDDCTTDIYNFATERCEHTYTCCGNDICEPENNETEESCPEDCLEAGEQPGDVEIMSVNHTEEIVTLLGYNVNMTNWTLEDEAAHVYTFPDDFVIDGTIYLHSQGCPSNNTAIDLYWGTKDGGCRTAAIWNEHDTATLRNNTGDVVDTYTYPPE